MADNITGTAVGEESRVDYDITTNFESPAYMNRLFCSTRERVAYILKAAFGSLGLGKYDIGSDFHLYKIYGISPTELSKANVGLGIYDLVNDPLSAAIIDNMRTRWGKFKPFQFLSILPNAVIGLFNCILPFLAMSLNFSMSTKLWVWVIVKYISETVNAFVGGGGYIDNVFTPNPNERSSLLLAGKFVSELGSKFPSQLAGIIFDLITNGKLGLNIVSTFVVMKTFWWVLANIPNIWWAFVSKERVPQSEKPPHPVKGILTVFKNKPLLLYTLSGFIDGIDVGTSESLYYSDVLKFNSIGVVGGILGSPISYASYPISTKLRRKYATKTLWVFSRGSIILSETLLLLVGLIGGKENGFYRKKVPMTIAYTIGNCLEMAFYATKRVVNDEINYEVLDYCEWKNGYRVEATINLLTGYINKIKNIFLQLINAYLLEKWAGYEAGFNSVHTVDTMFKMFVAAFAPKLVFDYLCLIPMFFYNIDANSRERMYRDLGIRRAQEAKRQKEKMENQNASAESKEVSE